MNDRSDILFLKEVYAAARNKYKPVHIQTLLLAEAPPGSLDRYFYFEDVKKQDSLFLEIMGVLYPEQKAAYLSSGRDTELKKDLLEIFKEDGFWLMDVSEVPLDLADKTLEDYVPDVLGRLQKHITKKTAVILIKANIYDLCYYKLLEKGYRVSPERIPFPGSGQQRVFREKFRKAVNWS